MTHTRSDHIGPWRYPYRDWTAAELIIANALRPTPLPLPELSRFQNHKVSSLTQIRLNLRNEGRLNNDYTVNLDNPTNKSLVGSEKFMPLPDPATRPVSSKPLPDGPSDEETDPDTPKDRKYFAKTLEKWITSGKAGANTPRFIEAWLELVGTSGNSGPPPPSTPQETHDRLVRLLRAVSESTAKRAIDTYLTNSEASDVDSSDTGEAPSGHLEPSEAENQEIEVQLRPRDL